MIHKWGVLELTETVINVQMLMYRAISLYRMYTRMAIKSVQKHLPKILLMPKCSNCPLVHEYKPNLQVGCIYNRITVINVQMTC